MYPLLSLDQTGWADGQWWFKSSICGALGPRHGECHTRSSGPVHHFIILRRVYSPWPTKFSSRLLSIGNAPTRAFNLFPSCRMLFLTRPQSIQLVNGPTVITLISHAAIYLPYVVSRFPDDDATAHRPDVPLVTPTPLTVLLPHCLLSSLMALPACVRPCSSLAITPACLPTLPPWRQSGSKWTPLYVRCFSAMKSSMIGCLSTMNYTLEVWPHWWQAPPWWSGSFIGKRHRICTLRWVLL
jgi:hypothetical protein